MAEPSPFSRAAVMGSMDYQDWFAEADDGTTEAAVTELPLDDLEDEVGVGGYTGVVDGGAGGWSSVEIGALTACVVLVLAVACGILRCFGCTLGGLVSDCSLALRACGGGGAGGGQQQQQQQQGGGHDGPAEAIRLQMAALLDQQEQNSLI